MAATVFETHSEKAISGALALVMHSLFFAMLIFSVTWKKPEPAAMVAELWSNLPPVAAPRVEPPPPPPKAEPEPPKPAPKVEPKPIPKAEPKPQPKAEIDLREKQAKEKKAKEQAALEKRQREEQALAEKKKREEQQQVEALKKQQAAEAEAKRLAKEQADAQAKLAQQAAAAQAREIDKYKQAIAARIKRFIVEPPNLQGNPEVEFEVIQLPGGEILGVKTRKASGQTVWDNAVERAILRAQPLPQPPDPALFKDVRELHLKFRPKE
jgi:colicin import membrane protein